MEPGNVEVANGKDGLSPMRSWLLVFFLLPFFPALASDGIEDIWRNNQAVDLLRQEKKTEAYDEFAKILSDSPFHPLYQFNMGAGFFTVEEKEKAKKMYLEVLKNENLPGELLFGSYYNLGVLYSMEKETDTALEYYQKALELNPDSKEIKTNIELMFAQGQGKGKGGGKSDKQDKDKKDKDKKENDEQEQEPQEFQNQPKQFKSKEMSKSDVKKILEELKKQEQRIRAKHERKGKKEAPRDKNW